MSEKISYASFSLDYSIILLKSKNGSKGPAFCDNIFPKITLGLNTV